MSDTVRHAEILAVTTSARRWWWVCAGVLAVAIAARLPLVRQGLWFDELTTYQNYVAKHVRTIVATDPYVPNNHVLHSLLAKAAMWMGRELRVIGPNVSEPGKFQFPAELVLRFPAMLAGALAGLALAWPLRRRPGQAAVVALAVSLHPWLINFSGEARGYTLTLLFCILGTNCLPLGSDESTSSRRHLIGYALSMAAALYTVPIAGVMLVAHGVTMLALGWRQMLRWLTAAGGAGALALVLYSPMLKSMRAYYAEPCEPTVTLGQFFDLLPRVGITGQASPGPAWIYAVVLILVILFGGTLAWRRDLLRAALVAFGIATLISVLAPLRIPGAHEVRFVPWLIPLTAIAVAGIITSLAERSVWMGAAAGSIGVLFSLACLYILSHTPTQPMRDAAELMDEWVKDSDTVADVNFGAYEALRAYSHVNLAHVHGWAHSGSDAGSPGTDWNGDPAVPPLQAKETWAMVPYEDLTRRDEPLMWEVLQRDYVLVRRLPGRLAPVAIYRRKGT